MRPERVKIEFAQRLKDLRQNAGLKRSDISELLSLKDRVIGNYENGERVPPLDKLIILADYFDVSIDYLVGRTSHPEGMPPKYLLARENALFEKMPYHLMIAYINTKHDLPLSELKSTIEAFEKLCEEAKE